MRTPDPLKLLNDAISAVNDELRKVDPTRKRDFSSQPVYHYCDGNAAMAIITTGKLRATNAEYMNDANELKHGVGIFDQALEARIASESTDYLKKILIEAHEELQKGWEQEIYCTCFSHGQDKLSQWRGYAGYGQGYAIGFNPIKLSKQMKCAYDGGPFDVSYDKNTKEQIAKTIVDSVCNYFLRLFKPDGVIANKDVLLGSLFVQILVYSMKMKESGFNEEDEFRFIFSREKSDPATSVEIRERNGLLIPFIEIESVSGRLPIEEIVMGPCLNFDKAEYSLRLLLRKSGYDDSVKIIRSSIPFLA